MPSHFSLHEYHHCGVAQSSQRLIRSHNMAGSKRHGLICVACISKLGALLMPRCSRVFDILWSPLLIFDIISQRRKTYQTQALEEGRRIIALRGVTDMCFRLHLQHLRVPCPTSGQRLRPEPCAASTVMSHIPLQRFKIVQETRTIQQVHTRPSRPPDFSTPDCPN